MPFSRTRRVYYQPRPQTSAPLDAPLVTPTLIPIHPIRHSGPRAGIHPWEVQLTLSGVEGSSGGGPVMPTPRGYPTPPLPSLRPPSRLQVRLWRESIPSSSLPTPPIHLHSPPNDRPEAVIRHLPHTPDLNMPHPLPSPLDQTIGVRKQCPLAQPEGNVLVRLRRYVEDLALLF